MKDGEVLKESLSIINKDDIKKMEEIVENYEVQTMHTKEATLEEIFIKVTGRELV
jgi:fluoroquinolone transport system ATP-binding protein